MAAIPLSFFTIASLRYPGYNLVQRGSHVVLAAEDRDNPFQLWYKDDSWRFVADDAGNPAFALINNGSHAALKADAAAPTKLSLYEDYHRSQDGDLTTLWTSSASASSPEGTSLFSVGLKLFLQLGVGSSPPESGEGVAATLSTRAANASSGWQLQLFEPTAYVLQCQWYTQILVAKNPHEDVTFSNASGTFNDEHTVVGVHSNNANGDREAWYKVPAGGLPEQTNSSFIILSKTNGKALKGSPKAGDKVVLAEFDPLDDNFVWSEDRTLSATTQYLAINLAKFASSPPQAPPVLLHWTLPVNSDYQNASYYHPLTIVQATSSLNRQQWAFVPFTSS